MLKCRNKLRVLIDHERQVCNGLVELPQSLKCPRTIEIGVQISRLQALAPDFAGFRSAVCRGSRSAALDPSRLAGLVDAVRQPVVGAVV